MRSLYVKTYVNDKYPIITNISNQIDISNPFSPSAICKNSAICDNIFLLDRVCVIMVLVCSTSSVEAFRGASIEHFASCSGFTAQCT